MGINIRSFKGIVSVRAVRTDTGEEIAATTQSAVTANADETIGVQKALSSAGSLAGELLAGQIIDAWRQKKYARAQKFQIVKFHGSFFNCLDSTKII